MAQSTLNNQGHNMAQIPPHLISLVEGMDISMQNRFFENLARHDIQYALNDFFFQTMERSSSPLLMPVQTQFPSSQQFTPPPSLQQRQFQTSQLQQIPSSVQQQFTPFQMIPVQFTPQHLNRLQPQWTPQMIDQYTNPQQLIFQSANINNQQTLMSFPSMQNKTNFPK